MLVVDDVTEQQICQIKGPSFVVKGRIKVKVRPDEARMKLVPSPLMHPVWFITDTPNFRLVSPLEFPDMVHGTSLI